MTTVSTQTRSKEKVMEEVFQIPEGVEVTLNGPNSITVRGKLGEITKSFPNSGVTFTIEDKTVRIRTLLRGRRGRSIVNTMRSHLRNMCTGVTKGFVYKMKIVSSHFPMSVKVSGNRLLIENFTGEKFPRSVEIPTDVKVEVKGGDVIVTGIDKEKVGLVAGKIENATRIKDKDPRKFLDGIYIYEKGIGGG